MTNYSAKNVDEYISGAPKEAHSHLREIRAAIQAVAPEADEGIRWGKPYYKFQGMLGGFDVFKNHISFEIWADELQSKDRTWLEEKGYKTAKSTFQIRYTQKVPTSIIQQMVQALAKRNLVKKGNK